MCSGYVCIWACDDGDGVVWVMCVMCVCAILTQQQELDVFGGLYTIFLQVLLDLFTPGQGRPFLGAHCTAHFGTPVR